MPEKEVEIGTVVSNPEGPSPTQVDFVITNGKVHRGQFVEIPYGEGTLIGMVTNVLKTNKYFERADAVKEFEAQGTKLFEQFPVNDWEYTLAQTNPLGIFADENKIKRTTFPPSPGSKVLNAKPEHIIQFLGFDEEKGLELGELEFHPVKVKLNMTRLLQKHCATLAMSGTGKSYFISCLIEELLQRQKKNGRIGIVVFDVHGEYTSFAEPPANDKYKDFSGKTRLIRARDLRIGVPKITSAMFGALLPHSSAPQRRELAKIITTLKNKMREGHGPYDLNDIKQHLLESGMEKEKMKDSTIQALIGWMHELDELELFGKTDNPSILDLVQPGTLTIVDLSDIIHQKKKQVIVAYLAHRIFYSRREKKTPPTAIILEEAHNFIPQYSSKEESATKSIMRTIAREGRKFGVSLCLVSQRPTHLDTTTLSQCNTHFLLRITNPNDLKHIGESAEGISSDALQMITSLKVGEGLIVGEAVNFPTFFKVRQRYSQPSKHEGSLEKAGLEFEENQEKNRKETEDLL